MVQKIIEDKNSAKYVPPKLLPPRGVESTPYERRLELDELVE